MSILVGSSLVHKKNTCVPFTPTRPILENAKNHNNYNQ